jgi:hypothetical protein
MNRGDDVLGDMTPTSSDDWLEEDPDVTFEEWMHFDDEEMIEDNRSEMLD